MPITIDYATRTIHRANFDHFYTADCFVNPDAYDFFNANLWHGREARAWVILDAGYVRAIVFAEYYAYSDQDALDQAVDSGKLDYLQVKDSELADYKTGEDSEGNPEYAGIAFLGNASEPFDQESLDMFTVPASLFALDPVIMAVIERASRGDAIDILNDARGQVHDGDAWSTVKSAINYLHSTLEDSAVSA